MSLMFPDDIAADIAAADPMRPVYPYEPPALSEQTVRRDIRDVIERQLVEELDGALPASLPDPSMDKDRSQEALKDFIKLREYCTQILGLPMPNATTPVHPQEFVAWAVHEGYPFFSEGRYAAAIAHTKRLYDSISGIQRALKFRDPTHHAFARAWLKRLHAQKKLLDEVEQEIKENENVQDQ
jgi:hypothetical protein